MATRLRGLRRMLPLVVAGVVATLLLAPTAGARQAANLSLTVNFFTNGTITVSLPDGTPVGTQSGAPTMIPAGYYAVMLNGPGGCTALPHFILKGPGESITDNLTEGEVTNFQYNAYFLPNSTYTWRNDANPSVVYTFATTNDVLGSPPPAPAGAKGISAPSHGTAQSQDVMGSGLAVASRHSRGWGQRLRRAQPDVQGQGRQDPPGRQVHGQGDRREQGRRLHVREGQAHPDPHRCRLRRQAHRDGDADRR